MATSTGSGGERLGDLPPWPSDEEGPVFDAPWQAQAFALAVKLSELGHFSWTTWAATLAEEIARADARGDPDDGSAYYHHWVAALEVLVADRDLIDLVALSERKDAWAEAYRRTPHGQPVELPEKS
ncbi:MAG: nitrile hydratase accessory protein [Gemmatimonadetes bacterium]|nr:nitrile hydratase accessory protein [Gemmatimonadota bacterium]